MTPVHAGAAMVQVGELAPPLEVRDLSGRPLVLAEKAPDRAVLVIFCTVGCVPCRESEPLVAAAGERYAERLMAVCVMLAEAGRVVEMRAAAGGDLELPFFVDTSGDGLFPTASAYGVMGTPTTFLIGRDGRVLWRQVGRITQEHLDDSIPSALMRDGGPVGVASSRPLPTAN